MVVVEEAYKVFAFICDLEVCWALEWVKVEVSVSDRCVGCECNVGTLCVRWSAIVRTAALEGAEVDAELCRVGDGVVVVVRCAVRL